MARSCGRYRGQPTLRFQTAGLALNFLRFSVIRAWTSLTCASLVCSRSEGSGSASTYGESFPDFSNAGCHLRSALDYTGTQGPRTIGTNTHNNDLRFFAGYAANCYC